MRLLPGMTGFQRIVLALTVPVGLVQGELVGQLGILTPQTLAGNHPATGNPWAAGDQYRLVFWMAAP